MTPVSIVLATVCLGGVWGSLIYYMMRLLNADRK